MYLTLTIRRLQYFSKAQRFGFVTPDTFTLRELGGVWARDYIIFQVKGKHSITWYSLVSFPDPFEKQKGGSGKWAGVEVYTGEC